MSYRSNELYIFCSWTLISFPWPKKGENSPGTQVNYLRMSYFLRVISLVVLRSRIPARLTNKPSSTTMRSRRCFAPPNSHPQQQRRHPAPFSQPPMHPPSSPNRCCFEGGYRSLGSSQTSSNSAEHYRFGRSSSPPSMLVPVAHTPTHSTVPTMRILRLFGLPTGRYWRGWIQHNNLQIIVMQIDKKRFISRTNNPHQRRRSNSKQ